MIQMSRPTFGPEEESAVLAVLRSGHFAQGERVREFEQAFAMSTGAEYAVATSGGTAALFLALRGHGVGPGDEVITSPMTFIATANAIVHAGAVPVFADVDVSLGLSVPAVARLIGPRTRGVVPVRTCTAIRATSPRSSSWRPGMASRSSRTRARRWAQRLAAGRWGVTALRSTPSTRRRT